ncbi:MAG TPA: hypothetical protein VFD82_20110 [Planctomycetota bacterium]|nr:hypothetical protein [Planctomycetota bacterium]
MLLRVSAAVLGIAACVSLLPARGGAAPAPQDPPPPSDARRAALERAARDLTNAGTASPGLGQQQGPVRLVDLSLDVMGAVGSSTERDRVLGDLQGGGHDPRKRGFTLQQAELSLAAAVDPYFTAQAFLVTQLDPIEGETVVELEEAYATTQQLPADLQLKVGHYLTEFGRMNQVHPHAWDWVDQPVIITRVLGPDGMRAPGARVSWLVPGEQYAELFLSVQNANGEGMASFLANDEFYGERPIGGRFFTEREVRSFADVVYSARAVAELPLADTATLLVGISGALGPNATGGDADTLIYGVDFALRVRSTDARDRWPEWRLQGEYVARVFDAADQVDDADPLNPVALPRDTLRDHGGYLQGLCGFAQYWSAGLRVDYATGAGSSYDAATQTFDRDSDMFRADRLRLSPLLVYQPSEFSRLRLQYNYDDTDALADPVHSVWLSFEVLIGTHPAHRF